MRTEHIALVRVSVLAGLVWAVDQGVKAWVRTNIPLFGAIYPIPQFAGFFRLTHLTNSGVAFGLLQGVAIVDLLVIGVLIAAVVFYLRHMPWQYRSVQVAAGMQLGGALGNITDRLVRGSVTDYIDFFVRIGGREVHYPPFNLADTAIVGGIFLLLWALRRDPQPAQPSPAETPWTDTSPEQWPAEHP